MANKAKNLVIDWHDSPEGSALVPNVSDEPELTTMPIPKAIAKLALPAIGSMILIMIFNIVDIWWVGKLGSDALAGISAASFLYWMLQSVVMLIQMGVNTLVARHSGAREYKSAGRVIVQGGYFTIILAMVNTLPVLYFLPAILRAMGTVGQVYQAAYDYLSVILYGLVCIFLTFHIDAAFRGQGDTKTMFKIIASTLTLNMVLDPLLIFGWGPVPAMGASGAAAATVISHLVAIIMGIALLGKMPAILDIRQEKSLDFNLFVQIIKIGAPVAFSGIMFSGSYMILSKIITDFGTAPLAAVGVGHRIEGLPYNIAVGFSFAASALVGQNLGAKKIDRASKSTWLCILYISILLTIVSVMFYIWGEKLFHLFSDNPDVIREGTQYLKTIAIFEIFLGLEVVFEGAFSGAGNSVPPMLISVPVTWARIPLSLLFGYSFGMGSQGIWWAISITTGIKGLLMAIWFYRGRWKTYHV